MCFPIFQMLFSPLTKYIRPYLIYLHRSSTTLEGFIEQNVHLKLQTKLVRYNTKVKITMTPRVGMVALTLGVPRAPHWWYNIFILHICPFSLFQASHSKHLPLLWAEEWIVRKKHTWDWWSLDFAFFVVEWSILKRIWRFHQVELQSTQDDNSVFLWE